MSAFSVDRQRRVIAGYENPWRAYRAVEVMVLKMAAK